MNVAIVLYLFLGKGKDSEDCTEIYYSEYDDSYSVVGRAPAKVYNFTLGQKDQRLKGYE
jgi:hypothetical protein